MVNEFKSPFTIHHSLFTIHYSRKGLRMTGQLNGFHHIALRANDFDATVRFYTEALGLTQTAAWGEGNGRAVMLHAGNGNYLEIFAGGANEPKPEGAYLHLAFVTEDCDAAFRQAVAAGAEVQMEPKSLTIPAAPSPLPVRIAFCRGLDGEVIEFFQQV
jgi:glyoxylase I family protein